MKPAVYGASGHPTPPSAAIIVALLGVLLAALPCFAQESIMENQNEKMSLLIQMQPLSIGTDGEINGLEWVNWKDLPHLAVSQSVSRFKSIVHVYPVDAQAPSTPVSTFDLPAQTSPPAWSVAMGSDDSPSIVLTRPGSMMCPLILWNSSSAEEVVLNAQNPLGVYSRPQFVKRRTETPALVVAVERKSTSEAITLFVHSTADQSWEGQMLYEFQEVDTGKKLQRAVLVQHDGEYLLFFGVVMPSAVAQTDGGAPSSSSPPASGPVPRVLVHCIRLDQDFTVVGEPFRPLGEEPLSQFDADAVGNRVVILGTTASGIRLSEGRIEDSSFVRTAQIEAYLPAPVSMPSVMIHANKLYLAVIENPGSSEARVLFARR